MPQGMAVAPAAPGSWSAAEPWGHAWKILIKQYVAVAVPLIVGTLAVAVPIFAVHFITSWPARILIRVGLPIFLVANLMSLVGLAVSVIAMGYVMGGFVTVSLKAIRGQPTSIGDVFNGRRFMMPVIIALIVQGVVVGVGSVLLVVPGVILALGMSLWAFLIVDQNLSGVAALKQSWEMMNGHKTTMFVACLIATGVYIAGSFACGVGVLLGSMPLMALAWAWIYLRIKGEAIPAPPS
jgi:uncharacterized membrane protein